MLVLAAREMAPVRRAGVVVLVPVLVLDEAWLRVAVAVAVAEAVADAGASVIAGADAGTVAVAAS